MVNKDAAFTLCKNALMETIRNLLVANVLQLPEGRGFYHKT
jgi:hypothetical protein